MTSLYRFRRLNTHTIDELRNSYLYFSTIDKLNDPMECFYRLFFKGEANLYSNLFKHFLSVMHLADIDTKLNGKESFRKDIVKNVFEFDEAIFKGLDFDNRKERIRDIIDSLKNREVWENEIINILKEVYRRFYPQDSSERVEFRVMKYFTQFRQFVVSELLVCCFSDFESTNERNCMDLSNNEILMWAHYASGHSGICLEFSDIVVQDTNLQNKIKHKDIDYEKSENYNVKNLQFSVGLALTNGDIKMNFLPHRLWLKDLEDIYNEKYKYIYNTKLNVWEYENEHRYSIRKSDLIDSKGLLTQKLKYDFRRLKSITFGKRTPQNKRDEIKKIIDKKCREHNHKVAFYEVYIDDSCGKFKKKPYRDLNYNLGGLR